MEPSIVENNVLAANERLSVAQEQLDAAIQTCDASTSDVAALKGVSERLREARACIDQLRQHIGASAEAVPARRNCTACGKSVRAQATLCGYCWTKLSPAS